MLKIQRLVILFFLVTSLNVHGQIAPVHSVTTVRGTIPPRLFELLDHFTEKLSVNILLKDLNVIQGEVFLKMYIQSNRVRLSTNPQFKSLIYHLDGGIPLILTSQDLRPYFLPENLLFDGYSRQAYINNGTMLPEGDYKIWFEVFEKGSGLKVSAGEAYALLCIQEFEPPILNKPDNSSVIFTKDFNDISFSWIPQHIGKPNSSFPVIYEFKLIQVPKYYTGSVESLFENFPAYYQTNLSSTFFHYSQSYPALQNNHTYAFQVRIRHADFSDESIYFKNKGYSPIHTFQYLDECITPKNLKAHSENPYTANLQWDSDIHHQYFIIFYRKTGKADWFTSQSYHSRLWLDELSPNTSYEVKVQAVCEELQSDESTVIIIQTANPSELETRCGEMPPSIPDSCRNNIENLVIGDVIHSGGSHIKITELNQNTAPFSGQGYVQLPYFNFVKIKVEFENISVNQCFQHSAGQIKSSYKDK